MNINVLCGLENEASSKETEAALLRPIKFGFVSDLENHVGIAAVKLWQ